MMFFCIWTAIGLTTGDVDVAFAATLFSRNPSSFSNITGQRETF